QYCKETGMFSSTLPSQETIQRLAALFKRLGKKVAEPDLTISDAFSVAIELEASEINEIYRTLTAHIDGPWHVIRKKIEFSEENHVQRLKNAVLRYGVSPAVQEQLARLTESAA